MNVTGTYYSYKLNQHSGHCIYFIYSKHTVKGNGKTVEVGHSIGKGEIFLWYQSLHQRFLNFVMHKDHLRSLLKM